MIQNYPLHAMLCTSCYDTRCQWSLIHVYIYVQYLRGRRTVTVFARPFANRFDCKETQTFLRVLLPKGQLSSHAMLYYIYSIAPLRQKVKNRMSERGCVVYSIITFPVPLDHAQVRIIVCAAHSKVIIPNLRICGVNNAHYRTQFCKNGDGKGETRTRGICTCQRTFRRIVGISEFTEQRQMMVLHRYRRHSDPGISRARLRRVRVRAWALDSSHLRQGKIRSLAVFSPRGLPPSLGREVVFALPSEA